MEGGEWRADIGGCVRRVSVVCARQHVCTWVHADLCMYLFMHVGRHVFIHVYKYIGPYVHMCLLMNVFVCMCVYTCMWIYVYLYVGRRVRTSNSRRKGCHNI